MPNGIVILNKSAGMTSHTATAKVRRLFGEEKAGHTGTLDPDATGVLPVLLGRAVKASEYMTDGDKHYLALLRLGVTTDTEDMTGTVLTESDAIPDDGEVLSVIRSFVGEGTQIPPMYSAIKIGGKKLVDLARRGETVERAPRPVTVFSIDAKKENEREWSLDVRCSKGTYIRTLCADIGAALGCGGAMAGLTRLGAAGFSIRDAHTLEELAAMTEEERLRAVIPVETLFSDLPRVTPAAFFARLAHAGQPLYQKKIGTAYPAGTRVRLCDENGFFALGEVPEEDPSVIRAIKQFVL